MLQPWECARGSVARGAGVILMAGATLVAMTTPRSRLPWLLAHVHESPRAMVLSGGNGTPPVLLAPGVYGDAFTYTAKDGERVGEVRGCDAEPGGAMMCLKRDPS